MRILLLAQRPQRRGAEVFAYQLAAELTAQGHDALLLFLYPVASDAALPHTEDQLLHGNENSPFERLPGVEPALARRLSRVINSFEPHIVQVNGARTVKYGAAVALRARRRSWALVYRNIGNPQDWVSTPLHKTFYRRIVMPQLNGVVSVSRTTMDIVRDFYGLRVPMISIPGGVAQADLVPTRDRTKMRAALRVPEDAPILVYVGSLTPEKRLDRILAALPVLTTEFPGLCTWIVGDGPLRSTLIAQAHDLGVSDAVTFFGMQENVADYLYAADLFALTSDSEGMPAVLLEAGYAGLPVVATDVGGIGECVLQRETGILVPPQDEEALKAGLLNLLRDADTRLRYGRRAKSWVGEHFTMDRVARRYLNFYEELTQGRRK